jgi:hypothetical protein
MTNLVKVFRSGYYKQEEIKEGSTFSACCGSKYYPDQEIKRVKLACPLGISLYAGKHGKEGVTDKFTTKHVTTPDGVITIRVRTLW